MFRYHYVCDLEHLAGYILWFWRLDFSGEPSFTEICEVLLRSDDSVFVQLLFSVFLDGNFVFQSLWI